MFRNPLVLRTGALYLTLGPDDVIQPGDLARDLPAIPADEQWIPYDSDRWYRADELIPGWVGSTLMDLHLFPEKHQTRENYIQRYELLREIPHETLGRKPEGLEGPQG